MDERVENELLEVNARDVMDGLAMEWSPGVGLVVTTGPRSEVVLPGDVLVAVDGEAVPANETMARPAWERSLAHDLLAVFSRAPLSPTATGSGTRTSATSQRRRRLKKRGGPKTGTAALLEHVKQRAKEERSKEDEFAQKKQAAMDAASEPVLSPKQVQLEQALQGSQVLAPLHVRVRNESYYYRNRRLLGGRRHMFMETKAPATVAEGSETWFGHIYRLSDEDKPEKIAVNEGVARQKGYKSQVRALQQCERAVHTRDANPAEAKGIKTIRPEQVLATHFHVLVVSQAFSGLSPRERASLVAECLVDRFHTNKDFPWSKSLKLRGFSYVGPHVRRLPFFRTFGALRADIELNMKTPGEWKPNEFQPREAERHGAARNRDRHLVNSDWFHATETATMKQLKYRLQDDKFPNGTKEELAEFSPSRRRKMGGVYSHHYFGLPKRIRDHLNDQIVDEERLQAGIDLESHSEHDLESRNEEFKATFGAAADTQLVNAENSKKVLYGLGAKSRRVVHVALRIQRIWRRRYLARALQHMVKRERAAVELQRFIRGYYGRTYARLLKKLCTVAASKIQSKFRALMEYRLMKAYKVLLTIAALRIQAVVRRVQAQMYLRWMIENAKAARQIQRVTRGFTSRRWFKLRSVATFAGWPGPQAAVKIQAMVRRKQMLRKYYKMLRDDVYTRIVVPASMLLARVYRGYRARLVAAKKRVVLVATLILQRVARGFVDRRKVKKLRLFLRQNRAVTDISRVFRGFVEREIFRRRRQRHHHLHMEIPSSIKIQARYRGCLARRRVSNRKEEWLAGLKIQLQFRSLIAKRDVRAKWDGLLDKRRHASACQIQLRFRGWSSRKRFREAYIEEVGRRVYAARVILRAWLRARDTKSFKLIKEKWEVEKSSEVLIELSEERKEITLDLADIRADLRDQAALKKLWQKRLKALQEFTTEAEMRMATVEYELDRLGVEEMNQGWGAAYDSELEGLTNQLTMAAEEMRQLQVKLRYCDDRVQELLLELEDVEADLDDNSMAEVAEFELLRRMELERCEQQAKDRFSARVRRERCKWQVADVRRNVIRRTRTDLDKHKAVVQQYEPKEVLTTLSFKKRRDWLKDEAELVKELEKKAKKKSTRDTIAAGQGNQNIRQTYDAIMSGCLEILKANTFDMRVDKPDMREDPVKVERLWGKELEQISREEQRRQRRA